MKHQRPEQVQFANARILVVDDEPRIRHMITRALSLSGYSVDEAAGGPQALALLGGRLYDLMVLDIQMPGMDGIEVMRRAREFSPELLVIILTGHGSLESAIAAIKSDAADYLLKPAGIHEIVAAVKRALDGRADRVRRHHLLRVVSDAMQELQQMSGSGNAAAGGEGLLSAGPFMLDSSKRLLTVRDDAAEPVALSESEMAVMAAFMKRPDTVLSCHDLARMAWNYDMAEDEARNLLRQYIFRLRQKVEVEPNNPHWIRTVRGRGYLFSSSDTAQIEAPLAE